MEYSEVINIKELLEAREEAYKETTRAILETIPDVLSVVRAQFPFDIQKDIDFVDVQLINKKQYLLLFVALYATKEEIEAVSIGDTDERYVKRIWQIQLPVNVLNSQSEIEKYFNHQINEPENRLDQLMAFLQGSSTAEESLDQFDNMFNESTSNQLEIKPDKVAGFDTSTLTDEQIRQLKIFADNQNKKQ